MHVRTTALNDNAAKATGSNSFACTTSNRGGSIAVLFIREILKFREQRNNDTKHPTQIRRAPEVDEFSYSSRGDHVFISKWKATLSIYEPVVLLWGSKFELYFLTHDLNGATSSTFYSHQHIISSNDTPQSMRLHPNPTSLNSKPNCIIWFTRRRDASESKD